MKFRFKRGERQWREKSDDPGHWDMGEEAMILAYLALRILGTQWARSWESKPDPLVEEMRTKGKTWEEVLK